MSTFNIAWLALLDYLEIFTLRSLYAISKRVCIPFMFNIERYYKAIKSAYMFSAMLFVVFFF